MKYDFVGLLNIWMNMSSESHTSKYFCSRFVMDIIDSGVHIDKLPSLYRPQDLYPNIIITLFFNIKYSYNIIIFSINPNKTFRFTINFYIL